MGVAHERLMSIARKLNEGRNKHKSLGPFVGYIISGISVSYPGVGARAVHFVGAQFIAPDPLRDDPFRNGQTWKPDIRSSVQFAEG
jgi:hypothetical protein